VNNLPFLFLNKKKNLFQQQAQTAKGSYMVDQLLDGTEESSKKTLEEIKTFLEI